MLWVALASRNRRSPWCFRAFLQQMGGRILLRGLNPAPSPPLDNCSHPAVPPSPRKNVINQCGRSVWLHLLHQLSPSEETQVSQLLFPFAGYMSRIRPHDWVTETLVPSAVHSSLLLVGALWLQYFVKLMFS